MKNGDPSEGCLLIRQAQQALCILSYNCGLNTYSKSRKFQEEAELAVCWHLSSCGTALGITSGLGGTGRDTPGVPPHAVRELASVDFRHVGAARSQTPRHPHEGSPPL